jgi:hypothetical protein
VHSCEWKGLFVTAVQFLNSSQDVMSAFVGLRIVVIVNDTSLGLMSCIFLCFVTPLLICVTKRTLVVLNICCTLTAVLWSKGSSAPCACRKH